MINIYDTLSHIAKSGYFTGLAHKDSIVYVENFLKKCYHIYDYDSIVDKIYKSYICCGNHKDTLRFLSEERYKIPNGSNGTVVTNNDIVTALVKHCASDFDITIVAKKMFCLKQDHCFVKDQIDILLNHRRIDIDDFYHNLDSPFLDVRREISLGTDSSLYRHGYEPWERNGLYEYGDNGELKKPN